MREQRARRREQRTGAKIEQVDIVCSFGTSSRTTFVTKETVFVLNTFLKMYCFFFLKYDAESTIFWDAETTQH